MYITKTALRIGRLLEKYGSWRLASVTYRTISILSTTKNPEILFRFAYSKFQTHQNIDNIYSMESAAALSPTHANWYYRIGFSHERLKNWSNAHNAYTAAIQLDPGIPNYYYRTGVCLDQMRVHQDAISHYRKSLALDKQNSRTCNRLIDAIHRTGPRWQELKALIEGHEKNLLNFQNKTRYADMLSAFGRYPEAAAIYETLALESTNPPGIYWFRGFLSLDQDKQQHTAHAYLTNALSADTKLNSDRFGIGAYYQQEGDWLNAARTYEDKLEAEAPDAELLYRTGMANDRLFRWDKAARYYQKALELETEHPTWHDRFGAVTEKLCGPDAAISIYEISIANNSIPRRLAETRIATLYSKSGRYEEAWNILVESQDRGITAFDNTPISTEASSNSDTSGNPTTSDDVNSFQVATRYANTGRFDRAVTEILSRRSENFENSIEYSKANRSRAAKNLAYYAHCIQSFPVEDGQVLFETNHGKSITCNPLAIFRELVELPEYASFNFIWVSSTDTVVPDLVKEHTNTTVVERETMAYFRYLATSEFLVNNTSFGSYFIRRDSQKYLNTWHGTPLKTIGKDVINASATGHSNIAKNLRATTHLLSPNKYTTEKLLSSNGISYYSGKVGHLGYPRIDSTLKFSSAWKVELRAQLGIPAGDQRPIVLYAPTWRGSLESKSVDSDSIAEDLKSIQNPKYHTVFRGHHFTESLIVDGGLSHQVVDRQIDTNDLLSVVDVLITDYSSIFFDFLPTKRPVLFYVPDLEDYKTNRGLYLDLSTSSPVIFQDVSLLRLWLQEHNFSRPTLNKSLGFDIQEYCSMDDGDASKRAIDFFFREESISDHEIVDTGNQNRDGRIKLLIRQSLIANGITAALLNLLSVLDPTEYSVTLLVDAGATQRDASRLENLQRVPDHVEIIWRNGRMIVTPEQQWIIQNFNLQHTFDSEEKKSIYKDAFMMEYRRVLGNRVFDYAIEYDGYSTFWASLILAAPTRNGSHIFMHADMHMEQKDKFPELAGVFYLCKYFNSVVSVSRTINEENAHAVGSHYGIALEKFQFATNVVDWKRIDSLSTEPLDSSVLEFIGGFSTTFITVGRLSPEKGHEKLLRAFARLRSTEPRTCLVVVGDGPLRLELNQLISELGIADSVLLTGALVNPYAIMNASDCLVLPSDHEGLGLVVLEAKHLNIPVISTDIPGPRDILSEGRGLIVPNSESGLFNGMQAFVESPIKQSRLSIQSFNAQGIHEFRSIFRH